MKQGLRWERSRGQQNVKVLGERKMKEDERDAGLEGSGNKEKSSKGGGDVRRWCKSMDV